METQKSDSKSKESEKNNQLLIMLLCSLAIPLSMSLWTVNIIYSKYIMVGENYDEPQVIPPTRWFLSCLIPLIVIIYGLRKKSLSRSGAFLSFFVGFVLTLSNLCFLAGLLVFFVTSSKATKVRQHLKRKFEEEFKDGGQRTWVQVLCNGGMATQLALLYLLDVGASEMPVDFVKDYRASWLHIGVMSTLASSNGEIWASELGSVFGTSEPVLITSLKRVPRGTNGGISFIGSLASAAGGFVVGLAHYLMILYAADVQQLQYAPPQWPIILCGAFAGFIGSLVDSVLGATTQYSGLDKDGKIVSHSSVSVQHICGRNILDNNSVNLVSSIIIGLMMPTVTKYFYPTS